MKKVLSLSIDERIELSYDLPSKGGTKEMQRSYKALRKAIEPTDDEAEHYKIRPIQQTGRLVAKQNREETKDFELEVDVLKALKDLLDRMEENNIFPEYGVDVDDQLIALLPKPKKTITKKD